MEVPETKAPMVVNVIGGSDTLDLPEAPKAGASAPATDTPTSPANGVHPKEKAPVTDPAAGDDAPKLSDEEKALLGIEDTPVNTSTWDDTHKKLFKDVTGHEDPDTFKGEYAKLREEHGVYSKENVELKAFRDRFGKLDARAQRALELELSEKGAGQKYLRSLPDIDLLDKDAKKIGDRQILDMHLPDHGITDEQWVLLKDPEADAGEVDALKRRIGFLRANAEDIHKKAQGSLAEEREAETRARQEASDRYNNAVAATVAHTKNSPMKAFLTDAHVEEVRQGRFISRFFHEDGISPKPELLDIILKADKYDSMKEAARKAYYSKGRSDGAQEIMAGLPATPKNGRAAPQPQQTKADPNSKVLDDIERGIR